MEKFTETQKMLGIQYYRFNEDNSLDLLRVVSINGENDVKVLNDKREVVKMKADYVKENFTEIKPDGLVTIVVADMGKDSKDMNIEDVIICLYRNCDMENGEYAPIAVCRQNITDFFANYLCSSEAEQTLCGVSVSKSSCPENIDYSIMTACNGVKKDKVAINIYIEDTVSSILGMAKPKRFDRTLESCFQEHIKSIRKIDVGQKSVDGYCRTLECLLTENNFQFDFDAAFNILAIEEFLDDNLVQVNDDVFGQYKALPEYIVLELDKIFKLNIKDTIVIPYSREMDIEEFAGTKYFILRDKINSLYLVNYTTEGEYRETDLEVIAAKEAVESHKSIISCNKNKYKNITR